MPPSYSKRTHGLTFNLLLKWTENVTILVWVQSSESEDAVLSNIRLFPTAITGFKESPVFPTFITITDLYQIQHEQMKK